MILAADIGGTLARFGCYVDGERLATATLKTAAYASPAALLDAAQAELPATAPLAGVGLAVAGPVLGEEARLTNGGLAFSRPEVARALGTERVALVNDMVALGAAVEGLPAERFDLLSGQPETEPGATKGVVAAGTGLGMGIIAGGECLPSEGGHARVAPAGAFERELIAATEQEADAPPVLAWEHYLSGRGIETLYRAVCTVWGASAAPLAAEEITRQAQLADADPVCDATLEAWCGLLATAAGTLAVTAMTLGGVYLGGSLPLAVAESLRKRRFRQRFEEAAWAAEFLDPMPLYLVSDPLAGLDGAALLADRA